MGNFRLYANRTMQQLVAVLATAVLVAVVAEPAKGAHQAAGRMTIKFNSRAVTAIGRFHPQRAPSLRSAIRAFGSPSIRRGGNTNVCRVLWRRLGVHAVFANLGRPRGTTACTPRYGALDGLSIKGRPARRWRTNRNLRFGASRARLLELYPNAEQHGRRWWLASVYSPIGDGGDIPIVSAGLTRGQVHDFHVYVGAEGE